MKSVTSPLNKRNTKWKRILFLIGVVFLLSFNAFCFLVVKIFAIQVVKAKTNGFISNIVIWNLTYIIPNVSQYLCTSLIRRYRKLTDVIANLNQINGTLMNRCLLLKAYLLLLLIYSTVEVIREIICDDFNFFGLWCLYAPSVIINVCMAVNAWLIKICTNQLSYLNTHMKSTIDNHQEKLFVILPAKQREKILNLHDSLITYHRIYDAVCDINGICGVDFVLYFFVGVTITLSTMYSYSHKVMNIPWKKGDLPIQDFSEEYWFVTFSTGVLLLIYVSHYLQREAKETGSIVHKFDVCSDEREAVIIHGLQLLRQKIEITAAGLFTIDFSIVGEIMLVCIVYISVFIQIDDY